MHNITSNIQRLKICLLLFPVYCVRPQEWRNYLPECAIITQMSEESTEIMEVAIRWLQCNISWSLSTIMDILRDSRT